MPRAVEDEPGLFGGLANRRVQQVRIVGLAPPTRQRELARPRIAGAVGAANQQQPIRIGGEEQRHGSMRTIGKVGTHRRLARQLAEEPIECRGH